MSLPVDRLQTANDIFLNSIEHVFRTFDEDNSGSIDRVELQKVLASMGYALNENQLSALLAEVDVDGGGSLDLQEFKTLIKLWIDAAQYKIFEGGETVSAEHIANASQKRAGTMLQDVQWRWGWGVILIMVAVYFWISVMAMHHYDNDKARRLQLGNDLLIPDIICTFFLMFEIVFRFRTGFLDGDELINDPVAIARNYLRSWLLFDVVTMLPMKFFSPDSDVSFGLHHIRLLLVLRIPSLFDASKRIAITSRYINFHYAVLPRITMLCAFVCGVLTLAIVHQRTSRDGDAPSLETTFAANVYWTMVVLAGVGYGDIVPHDDNQRWFANFMFIASMLSNGFFIGSMVSMMQEADVESTRQTRLVMMQAVLRFFEVPELLQQEILQFQNHILMRDVSTSYSDIINMLPPEMQNNIFLQSRVPLLKEIAVFRNTHVSTLVQVAKAFVPAVCVPERYLAVCGEENDSMHIINYGFVDVLSSNGQYLETLKRADCFGECGLLRGNERYSTSFKALTYVDYFEVDRSSLENIRSKFPKFDQDMRQRSMLVYDRFGQLAFELEGNSAAKGIGIGAASTEIHLEDLDRVESEHALRKRRSTLDKHGVVEDVEDVVHERDSAEEVELWEQLQQLLADTSELCTALETTVDP